MGNLDLMLLKMHNVNKYKCSNTNAVMKLMRSRFIDYFIKTRAHLRLTCYPPNKVVTNSHKAYTPTFHLFFYNKPIAIWPFKIFPIIDI